MPSPIPTRILRALALLAGLVVSVETPAATCPQGQRQVCLDSCVCLPDLGAVLGPVIADTRKMAGQALGVWLQQSRDQAEQGGTLPVPLEIRAQLQAYFPDEVLMAARYSTGALDELNAAQTIMQNPDTEAVTLVDVIVFRSEEDAQTNVALWAHELWHVKQYQEWGVQGFANRYSEDFDAVEAPAYEMQLRVARDLRDSRLTAAAPH
ncbi:hypothetical protein H681_12800 [Pseudomonas sp. ATCC 13867]|uniref:eCIS core domain-containing protein n=1 Tax=Pseudomonas sp. ATCC 13867 TaxID=1294143 RepID=UPI0002C4F748|nr:DUF4157 domain-containing protein [Pseudomonas sp. ATCC 13867]AGI24430.1 hypothetical protein H681_12800 [Pseudomonas sp. ATCC 13867]RFQ37074.1 DUF4157 domain-containing protein [Pseudomonas sp. ATCC 13867]